MNKKDIYYTVNEQDVNIYIEKYLIKSYQSLGDIDFNEDFLFIVKSSYYKTYTTKFKNDYRCSKLEFIDKNGNLITSQDFRNFILKSIYIETNYLFNISFVIFGEDPKGFSIDTTLYLNSGELSEENVINKSLKYVDELKSYENYSINSIKDLVEKKQELIELKKENDILNIEIENLTIKIDSLQEELVFTKKIIQKVIKNNKQIKK